MHHNDPISTTAHVSSLAIPHGNTLDICSLRNRHGLRGFDCWFATMKIIRAFVDNMLLSHLEEKLFIGAIWLFVVLQTSAIVLFAIRFFYL